MSIWVTEMSNWRPSMALDLVSPDTACLEHPYATECGRGTCAAIEPLLMTLPVGRQGESVRNLEHSPRLECSLTSSGSLRLEYLECFTGAEERSDEVHVHDGREELNRHFLDRVQFVGSTRILHIPVSQGKKEKRTFAF